MSIENLRSGKTVPTSAPVAEHAAVGMTRTEFAKKLGIAALLSAAAFMPATAVAGCIGDEFTVRPGTAGAGGEGPTAGATNSAGTGGKENVGGGTSGTGGKENVGGGGAGGTGGKENVGGASSSGGTGGENVGGQGGSSSGTGGMENTGGQGGTGGVVNVGGGGAGGCLDIPVTITDTNGQYEVKQYDAACSANGADTLGNAGFETMAQELCVKNNGSLIVQTKDAGDMNALEFTSTVKPTKVEFFQLGVNTPISDSEADAFCTTNGTQLNPTSADQDPTANGYKYVPTSVGPTNILKVTF